MRFLPSICTRMNTRLLGKPIDNIERRVCPKHDGIYTLEELCRIMWREDRASLKEIATNWPASNLLIAKFEREDTERAIRR